MAHLKAFHHHGGNQLYHQIKPLSSFGAYPLEPWCINEFDTSESLFGQETAVIPSVSGKPQAFDDTLLPPQEERADEESLEPIQSIFNQKLSPPPSPSARVDGVCDPLCLGTITDCREGCHCVLGECAFADTTLYGNAPSPPFVDSNDREEIGLGNWDETFFRVASDIALSDFDIPTRPARQSPVLKTQKYRKAQKKRQRARRQPKVRHGRNSRVRILKVELGSGEKMQVFQWRRGIWNSSNEGQHKNPIDLMTPGAWTHLSITIQADGRSRPLNVNWCHKTLTFSVVNTTTGEVAYLSKDQVQDMVEEVAAGSIVHWDLLSTDHYV
ncbi:uncharacterized protein JN550_013377 [Neoarthrinium moseri]|uniref:uncharacterized protein n=1 Tax=Neoarthrinium moseri TaxID=1658444 RepID=UPI001FDE6B98|nr:uncharacterized protein JN550_013377 [Neoarthrinium moseri]KAI1857242.1 hypothetical protein JN550_013377 [Neoarthrinium moseri]